MASLDMTKVKSAANDIALKTDSDVLIFNFGIEAGFDGFLLKFLRNRAIARKNLLLFLTTEGGDADAAYRIARHLQDRYSSGKFTVVVPSWCKSAGTLVCTGAHELMIGPAGELGPLDVQIAKTDELGERSSGLAIEASFEKLQEESTKLFLAYLDDIKQNTGGRITFKTAAEMSANIVVGMMQGIFEKMDPLVLGEDYRSNLVAQEYAVRLNVHGKNLKAQGLHMLCRGYPSHRFVIDRTEACDLFNNISELSPEVGELADLLDSVVQVPRNGSRNQRPFLEFLNDEQIATAPASGRRVSTRSSAASNGGSHARKTNGTAAPVVPGGPAKGSQQKRRQPPADRRQAAV